MLKAEAMLKALAGEGCLGRADVDEPVFVIRAMDKCGAAAVHAWAMMAEEAGAPPEKVASANDLGGQMIAYRQAHGGGKVPD